MPIVPSVPTKFTQKNNSTNENLISKLFKKCYKYTCDVRTALFLKGREEEMFSVEIEDKRVENREKTTTMRNQELTSCSILFQASIGTVIARNRSGNFGFQGHLESIQKSPPREMLQQEEPFIELLEALRKIRVKDEFHRDDSSTAPRIKPQAKNLSSKAFILLRKSLSNSLIASSLTVFVTPPPSRTLVVFRQHIEAFIGSDPESLKHHSYNIFTQASSADQIGKMKTSKQGVSPRTTTDRLKLFTDGHLPLTSSAIS
jgi:hypothetical protein